jgi:hypothetical protein
MVLLTRQVCRSCSVTHASNSASETLLETRWECGGAMKAIACIGDPVVIQRILNHLRAKGEYQDAFRLPKSCGPPQTSLFGQGSRSADGSDWTDHKAEIRPI